MEIVDIPVRLALVSEEIRACYRTMRHFRPHLSSEDSFVKQALRQIQEGYHLAYIIE